MLSSFYSCIVSYTVFIKTVYTVFMLIFMSSGVSSHAHTFNQEMATFLSAGISYLFIALILMQHKGQKSENFVVRTVWLT
jgi:hypothetical protein